MGHGGKLTPCCSPPWGFRGPLTYSISVALVCAQPHQQGSGDDDHHQHHHQHHQEEALEAVAAQELAGQVAEQARDEAQRALEAAGAAGAAGAAAAPGHAAPRALGAAHGAGPAAAARLAAPVGAAAGAAAALLRVLWAWERKGEKWMKEKDTGAGGAGGMPLSLEEAASRGLFTTLVPCGDKVGRALC